MTEAEAPSLIETAQATTEAPTTEAKPEAETAPAEVFVESEFKLPEGVALPDDMKSEFFALAKEHKIPTATANALAEFQAKLAKQGVESQAKLWENVQTEWQGEVKADPEIGGEKLPGVLTNVAKVVDKYGSPELRQVMTLTGAGNNIHVVRFLNNIAKDFNEATPVVGNPVSTQKSLAESLYNTMKG